MNNIKTVVTVVFFLYALICLFVNLKPDSIFTRNIYDKIVYNPNIAASYSQQEVHQILRGKERLDIGALNTLIEKYQKRTNTINENNSGTSTCNGIMILLETERNDRIEADIRSKNKSRWIYFLTIIFGFMLFFLKTKKFGVLIINNNNTREVIVGAVEFFYCFIVITISTFL